MKKLKILQVGPGKKELRTEFYIKKEFKLLGHSVLTFNDIKIYNLLSFLSHIFFRIITYLFNPDLIIYSKAKKISIANFQWANKKYTTIMWYFDIQVPFQNSILERARRVDIFYITNIGQIPFLTQNGVNARYLPQACYTDYSYKSNNREYLYDVSFIGNNNKHMGMREMLLKQVSEYYDLHLWGKRWETGTTYTSHERIFGEKYANVCIRSKIVLDIKSYEYCLLANGYFSNRVFITLGYGGFLLSQKVKGKDEIFEDGKHLVYFETQDELIELIGYYLSHDEEREKIARQGKEYVLQNHTYRIRIAQILDDIKHIQNQRFK